MSIAIAKMVAAMDAAKAAEQKRQDEIIAAQAVKQKAADVLVQALITRIEDMLTRAIDGETVENFPMVISTKSITVDILNTSEQQNRPANPLLADFRAQVDAIHEVYPRYDRDAIWTMVRKALGAGWKCEDFADKITFFYYDDNRK